MKNFLATAFLLFTALCTYAQSYTVTGTMKDQNGNPLPSATVFTETVNDSTLVNYTITNSSGAFELTFRTSLKEVNFVSTYTGFKNFSKRVSLNASKIDLGVMEMEESAFVLEGVSVVGERAPITIKTDTLEFNANSFKVAPDANVEKLLQQLPGVEIDSEGTITVNGKEVNNILVNGKPFFGKDGKIATQNLPAEMIEKIQVSDTKTKQEEISGADASSDEKTINLTIAEDKNKGIFGRATAGYGSDDRYESSLLFNTFKGDQKISVLASSNNINSVGFSMDEIFDNMGGGRSTSIYYNDNGSFGINGLQFGGNTGITKSNMVGLNFADSWFGEKVEPNANYYYGETQTDNVNRSSTTNFLPDGTTFTESEYTTDNHNVSHNFSTSFEIEVDSTFEIYAAPSYSKSINKNRNSQMQATTDEVGDLLNESNSATFTDTDTDTYGAELYFNKKLGAKKGRSISLGFDVSGEKQDGMTDTQSETYFYETGDPADIRNQNRFDDVTDNNYQLEIEYREPLFDSLNVSVGVNYEWRDYENVRNTFDFNSASGTYDSFNDIQSNNISSATREFVPNVTMWLRKKKIRGRLYYGSRFTQFDNTSFYIGEETQLNKNYVLPEVNARLNFNLGKSKSIWLSYRYNVNLPSASQILPVANLSNPLRITIGNGDLKPSKQNSLYMNFNNYDYPTRSGYFLYGNVSLTNDQVVSSTVYDASNRATTTYQNVDNVMSSWFGGSYSKTFKKDARSIRLQARLNGGYSLSKGLTNAALYEAKTYQLSPRVNLTYEITDMLSIEPSYTYSYNKTNYENYLIESSSNFTHNVKLQTTTYWPNNLVWGNDFGYTYNSNIADGYQKDFYLWNMSLGYNFFDKKLLAKVKVYDLLNQNTNATRTITPTAIVDEQNTVLQRYVMFSLTYKLEMFGGKKKNNDFMIFD